MRSKPENKVFFSLIIVFLLILPNIVQAEKQKVRLVVKNAHIRSKPSIEAEIIQSPPLNSVFEVNKKEGDWYEIQFRSQLGVLVTGYIHEMFVEIVSEVPEKPEPEEPVEKKVPPKVREEFYPKGDLAIMGGVVSGSFLDERSSYSYNWSDFLLESVNESGSISHRINNPMGFGISFSYLFLGGLGIQVRADFNTKLDVDAEQAESIFNITWTWTTGAGTFDSSTEWPLNLNYTLTPISFNLIYKAQSGGKLVPYFSAGATYFSGTFETKATMGFGFSVKEDINGDTAQTINYTAIPISINESLSGIGINIGGGLEFRLLRNIALNVDVAYFNKSEVETYWKVAPGNYDDKLGPSGFVLVVTQEMANAISEEIGKLMIKPSFFKIQAGIKFIF